MREMVKAIQIFNPIFLSKYSDEDIISVLSFLTEKLTIIGYRQFNKRFIDKLKKEIPKVIFSARREHDLDKFKLLERYKTRL